MTPDTAFEKFQTTVNADPEQLAEARRRRDVVLAAMGSVDDVDGDDSFVSGSLARGTQRGFIHDVDLVIVYDGDEHAGWGAPGDSAADALEHARGQVKDVLGTDGDEGEEIRHTLLRNHAVKCFLDDPDDPQAFTVDLVPALRQADGRLLIPEQLANKWTTSDPEYLIDEVKDRNDSWNQFVPLIRQLKHWNAQSDSEMKNLTVEVLALHHLDHTESRAQSLSEFFTAAAANILYGVEDPAGVCGEIQPDLDLHATKDVLDAAADLAWRAYTLGRDGNDDDAVCTWRALFGDDFPRPPSGCDGTSSKGAPAAIGTAATPRRIADAPQG